MHYVTTSFLTVLCDGYCLSKVSNLLPQRGSGLQSQVGPSDSVRTLSKKKKTSNSEALTGECHTHSPGKGSCTSKPSTFTSLLSLTIKSSSSSSVTEAGFRMVSLLIPANTKHMRESGEEKSKGHRAEVTGNTPCGKKTPKTHCGIEA